jgi:hypothetical protein
LGEVKSSGKKSMQRLKNSAVLRKMESFSD